MNKDFIDKPISFDLIHLSDGDKWDVLSDTFLKYDCKPESMKKFLTAMKQIPFSRYYILADDDIYVESYDDIYDESDDDESVDENRLSLHMRFLDLICRKNTRGEYSGVVVEFLKTYFKSEDIKEILTLGHSNLKLIFESCEKEQCPLFSHQGQPGFISDEDAVQIFSYFNIIEVLKEVLIAGVTFDFSLDAFTRLMINFISFNRHKFYMSKDNYHSLILRNLERKNLPRVMYRTMQTFQIYEYSVRYSSVEMKLVQYFWISIPDPFLTKEDFDDIDSGLNLQYRGSCSSWYTNELELPAAWMRQPRSLKHISRCVVRRRLAENFQLPNIKSLPLPKKLHSYLNWEDLEDIY